MLRYLYLDDVRFALLELDQAPGPSRSRLKLELPEDFGHTLDPQGQLAKAQVDGLILGLNRGWAGRSHFRLLDQAKERGVPAFFYWPREEAIEAIDEARRALHFRVGALARLYSMYRRRPLGSPDPVKKLPEPPVSRTAAPRALPIPANGRVKGRGLYLRTDYWAKLESGGSYGHTCHVARELARRTDGLVALVPHRYVMLDEFSIHQVLLTNPASEANERDIIVANIHYYPILKAVFEVERPAYVYERLVLGSFVVARLCREFDIPYIAEYNGSEISMGKGFGSSSYAYERELLRIEDFAFREASLIVVVSKHIKADLVSRGVDPARILLNPNGGDPEMYAPGTPDERETLRSSLGFAPDDKVVGFCGTFGGWHGIDVLAAAIPRICASDPRSRFLLIGDGNFKSLVDEAVASHHLANRVIRVGRTTQADGARFQKACDILVSPHSRNMVDGPFFGSPTKLFEYMGYGVGIVASDLEQIGEVLSPALRPEEIGRKPVTTERGVLCNAGDVEGFVVAVLGLLKNPEVSRALGANARQALLDHFTWSKHVERIWLALAGRPAGVPGISEELKSKVVPVPAGTPDDLLAGLIEELGGGRLRILAIAIENPGVLAPLKGVNADLLIVEPWGRDWTAVLGDLGPNVRVIDGDITSVSRDLAPFDALVTERGFDFGDAAKDLLDEARSRLTTGGRMRARVRLHSSLHFWVDLITMSGLARKGLAEYSPDEIVGRSEPQPVLGMIARTFDATEIETLAARFGEVRLRQSDREPPTSSRRALLALGVGRNRGWRGNLSLRFKGSSS